MCPSLGSTAEINTMTTNNLGREGFIWLTRPDHSRSRRKKVGAGTEGESREGRGRRGKLLAGLLPDSHVQLPLFYLPGPPTQGLHRQPWVGLSHNYQQSKKCQTCLQANTMEALRQWRRFVNGGPFLPGAFSLCHVNKT